MHSIWGILSITCFAFAGTTRLSLSLLDRSLIHRAHITKGPINGHSLVSNGVARRIRRNETIYLNAMMAATAPIPETERKSIYYHANDCRSTNRRVRRRFKHTTHFLSSRGGEIDNAATSAIDEGTNNCESEDHLTIVASLFQRVDQLIVEEKLDEAFSLLAQIYSKDPNTSGLNKRFQTMLSKKIDSLAKRYESMLKSEERDTEMTSSTKVNNLRIELCRERMGLSSLYIDNENYEEASKHLKCVVKDLKDVNSSEDTRMYEKAICMLYRCQAAVCDWSDYERNGQMLNEFLQKAKEREALATADEESTSSVPPIHPFEALKWPCVTLEDATFVAKQYSKQRAKAAGTPAASATEERTEHLKGHSHLNKSNNTSEKRIRLGYISPDFTGAHPLAFLMQHVFNKHNTTEFDVFLYTLSKDDNSFEVQNIRDSVPYQNWIDLTPSSGNSNLKAMVQRIRQDNLDIMIDLCGHSGTSTVMEIMSCRVAPVQISYMGFPGSSGANNYIDYLICDDIVVPPSVASLRHYYTESLLLMPHCYFVNSHKYLESSKSFDIDKERQTWNLPKTSFVFCCHSRPDKIDPTTFHSWMKVLKELNDNSEPTERSSPVSVLWLLKSGKEMEYNLRRIATKKYNLSPDTLVFCDVAPRDMHLERLKCADIFLDTPAYNAHTVGCDCLWAGVPMISLLQVPSSEQQQQHQILSSSPSASLLHTDKLPSRVGASLLSAVGLHDKLVAHSMKEYEAIMKKCVLNPKWFEEEIQRQLTPDRLSKCPLFDTSGWVRNLETGLKRIISSNCDKQLEHLVENHPLPLKGDTEAKARPYPRDISVRNQR